jgi:hypothetical protein
MGMIGPNDTTMIVRNKRTGKLETICLETGEVLNALNAFDMSRYKFNLNMAAAICQAIREGRTLKSLHSDPEYPDLSVIHYWRRTNATFDEEIKLARKERAEYYHDKVLDLADNTPAERDEIALSKFRADQYKWAAEKGDPGSYGNKIEHTGSNTAPAMVIVTGIKRTRDVENEKESEGDVLPKEIQVHREQSSGGVDGGGVESSLPDYSTAEYREVVPEEDPTEIEEKEGE